MYQKQLLRQQLEQLGLNPEDTVMIHSSMKAIGPVEGGADTVLDVFMEYFGEKGLLILPTHSWAQMGEGHMLFCPEQEPSCVGILTELFRKRPGVVRSLHPTHSVCAYGKDADSYCAGEEKATTPCPREGCWGRLYDRKAKIVFLGCPSKRNTFLHSVEEWNEIPDRLTDNYAAFQIQMPDGSRQLCPMKRHYNSKYPDISQFYDKIEPALLAKGIAWEGKFGDARCVVAKAVEMADLVCEYLKRNPDLFLGDAPVPEEWYQ